MGCSGAVDPAHSGQYTCPLLIDHLPSRLDSSRFRFAASECVLNGRGNQPAELEIRTPLDFRIGFCVALYGFLPHSNPRVNFSRIIELLNIFTGLVTR